VIRDSTGGKVDPFVQATRASIPRRTVAELEWARAVAPEELLVAVEVDRIGQLTHHLVDEPVRTARAVQDPAELLVRPDTNDRGTHQL
jgi:hypothetical protein